MNYLITSALIGTAAELCRFPELIAYAARMAFARNEGEKRLVRKVCGMRVCVFIFLLKGLLVFE